MFSNRFLYDSNCAFLGATDDILAVLKDLICITIDLYV